jgi:tRNA-dihydrouridine synthase B
MKILWLAPMDWFTDFACREITKDIRNKYWDKTKYDFFLWTEFMNADWYIINPQWVIRHLLTNKWQTPVIAQIFWWNEDKLLECFIDIEKKYSDLFYWLELNLGCPARTVVQNGWWSAMLQDKKRTLDIIKKIRKSIKMPFSIKTRTWINEDDIQNQKDFLIEASQYLDMISIHGRTVKQWYGGDIDRDFIYDIKKNANPNCKIIWNWAVKSYHEIDDKIWTLDGIMIWQWAIWNPRIFSEHEKSETELQETIFKHLDLMLSSEYFFETTTKNNLNINYNLSPTNLDKTLSAEVILVQFRKHLFQYIKWLTWSKEFKVEISQIKGYENFVNKMKSFFS